MYQKPQYQTPELEKTIWMILCIVAFSFILIVGDWFVRFSLLSMMLTTGMTAYAKYKEVLRDRKRDEVKKM